MNTILDLEAVRTLAGKNGLEEMFSTEVIERMELRRYGDGEAVCSVGDRLESMFILVKGSSKFTRCSPTENRCWCGLPDRCP